MELAVRWSFGAGLTGYNNSTPVADTNPGTDNWIATTTTNAPERRAYHTAVWSGNEMIVWGGFNDIGPFYLNTGGRYCAQPGPTPTPTHSTLRGLHRYQGPARHRIRARSFVDEKETHCSIRLVQRARSACLRSHMFHGHPDTLRTRLLSFRRTSETFPKNAHVHRASSLPARD